MNTTFVYCSISGTHQHSLWNDGKRTGDICWRFILLLLLILLIILICNCTTILYISSSTNTNSNTTNNNNSFILLLSSWFLWSLPSSQFLPFFFELIFFFLFTLLLASAALGRRGGEADNNLGCGKLPRGLQGPPLRGTSDQLCRGTYGFNTQPWIQPASEWLAVGDQKSLLSVTVPGEAAGHRGLKGFLYSSAYNWWLRHSESAQPGCQRPFAFLSWFWRTAYSLDWKTADFIHNSEIVILPYWSLLQHSLYQLFHCILNELYHKSK